MASSPSLCDLLPEINFFISHAKILVGYNLQFDMRFLIKAGVSKPNCLTFDVMKAFALITNTKKNNGSPKWRSLEVCAQYYGVSFRPHDALEDARATLQCFKSMTHKENEDCCEL